MTDINKVIALNHLRAQMLDRDISPFQKRYYLELVQWLENQNIKTAEEATDIIKDTPYYDGAALAKELDGIHLRLRAAHELGYEDVEKIHEERREKLLSRGMQAYAFSQEWIDDYNRVQDAIIQHMEKKEIFGQIFYNYIQILANSQEKQKYVKELDSALEKLEQKGVTFFELAQQNAYKQLTMTTEKGMERFIKFIENYRKTKIYVDSVHLEEEQKRIGSWAKRHAAQLKAVKAQEQWYRANCIAVPSDDTLGYDFIAMKVVKL